MVVDNNFSSSEPCSLDSVAVTEGSTSLRGMLAFQ